MVTRAKINKLPSWRFSTFFWKETSHRQQPKVKESFSTTMLLWFKNLIQQNPLTIRIFSHTRSQTKFFHVFFKQVTWAKTCIEVHKFENIFCKESVDCKLCVKPSVCVESVEAGSVECSAKNKSKMLPSCKRNNREKIESISIIRSILF